MKEDFSELIQYLDEKFRNIEGKLDTKATKADFNELLKALEY